MDASFLGELHTHRRDDAVLRETKGLSQGIAPSGSPAPAPDGTDHRHADDARRDLLDDGLPLNDGAVHHDALDAGDHQRIVDLQIGLGGISAVVDFDDAVPVADIRRNGEGGGHPSGRIGVEVGSDHLTVTAHGDPGCAGREIGAHHRDAGLSPVADVRCDLNRRLRLFEHRVRIDVLVFGPVSLFDQDLFRSGKQHWASLEQCVACGLVHLEHLGRSGPVRCHELLNAVDAGAPFAMVNVRLSVIGKVVGVDAFLGLCVPILKLVVHLELSVVVLEVLHILDDLVDLIHGDAGQPEVEHRHSHRVGRAVNAAKSQRSLGHNRQLGKVGGCAFQPLDFAGGGVNDVLAAQEIVVIDAAVRAVHRIIAQPGRRASKRRIGKDVAGGVSRRRQGKNDKTPWGSTHRVLC